MSYANQLAHGNIETPAFMPIGTYAAIKTLSTDEIKKGCERDIMKVDERLRLMEKKMWTIAGGLIVISFMVSVPGQRVLSNILTPQPQQSIIRGQ